LGVGVGAKQPFHALACGGIVSIDFVEVTRALAAVRAAERFGKDFVGGELVGGH
jgi:hypothetical protein